ncbi:MAG: thrombospondin type 3 repeat-containing protein [Myxococcales bacterium]|nr:thrombospondin type 3 repeat-containing protein [Myxococcales bacterium]
MPARLIATPLLAWLLSSSPAVFAQTRPSLDVRTWRPPVGPEAGLVLEPVVTPGPGQWNAGVWVHYSHGPVVLGSDVATASAGTRPLAHVLGADLTAALGLGERFQLGLDLPAFLWQDGAKSLPPAVVSEGAVRTTGLGDLALQGKATLVGNDHQGIRGGFGLAALGTVTLPTGDERGFAGEGSVTASLSGLVEYALGVAAIRASLGYKLRTVQRTWPDPSGGGVTFGDEIPWSLGISARPKAFLPSLDEDDRQIWEIAAAGSLPVRPVAPFGLGAPGASLLSPVLIAADDRVALGHDRDTYLLLGAQIGLDHAYGTPEFRGIVGFGWAPRAHDRDNDGVPDDRDECPDLPEDRDGIQDADGCPEDDADGDGVPDTEDACPLVPGKAREHDPKRNGCPEGG